MQMELQLTNTIYYLIQRNLCSFDQYKMLKNRHLDDLGIEKGDVDSLAGGPPCFDSSMDGKRALRP